MRRGDAAGQQQGLIYARFALILCDPIFQRGFILDDPRRKMRHHRKPFFCQSRCGGHHVFDWRAFDMCDIDPRLLRQDRPEIFNLLGGSGHHLDRIICEKAFQILIKHAGLVWFFCKVE